MRRQNFMLFEEHPGRFFRTSRILFGFLLGLAFLLLLTVPSQAGITLLTPGPGNGNAAFPYQGQPGTPAYLQNTFHPEAGCQWLGAAGQVINADAAPVPGVTVKLGGTLGGAIQDMQTVTGAATDYGPGGFEFVLGKKLQASMQTLWLQVFDSSGAALSEKVFFNTYNECSKNLVLVNFIAAGTPPTNTPHWTSTFATPIATGTAKPGSTSTLRVTITPAKTMVPATATRTKSPTLTKTKTAVPSATKIPTIQASSTPSRTATVKPAATRTPTRKPTPSRTPSRRTISPASSPENPSGTPVPNRTVTSKPTVSVTQVQTTQPGATGKPFLAQYVRQPGSPAYQSNFAHAEKGCAWMGVGGQVFDEQGKALREVVVEVQGSLGGTPISSLTLTGLAQAYGSGGYEIRLANAVAASQGSLGVTLYDLKGNRLTARTEFNTVADCKRNLILMNFIPLKSTASATPTSLKASSTPVATKSASATLTPSGQPTISTSRRFEIQAGGPQYIRNVYRSEVGCTWMGIAGQVFLKDGKPARDLIVEVGGRLEGKVVFGLGLTGASPRYGSGGYEIRLGDHPAASTQEVWIVLKRLDGSRLSEHIYLNTRADCAQNLILVNFRETSQP